MLLMVQKEKLELQVENGLILTYSQWCCIPVMVVWLFNGENGFLLIWPLIVQTRVKFSSLTAELVFLLRLLRTALPL